MTHSRVQVIYTSAATHDFSEDELEALLDTARNRNGQKGISGLLVYHNRSFLQVLEGPKEQVLPLFEALRIDPRHEDIRELLRKDIQEREFGEWFMGFVDTRHSNDQLPGFFANDKDLQDIVDGSSTAREILQSLWQARIEEAGLTQ